MKNKVLSALLSLVIAIGMWMYVVTTVSTEAEATFNNIPVVFEGETAMTERRLMLTSGKSANVSLKISGKRSDLQKINYSNITVKVNLASIYDPGDHDMSYTVSFPGDVPDGAITTESRSPSKIRISVDQKVMKDIPVRVNFSGAAPDGFISDPENAVLDYNAINVSGPSAVVNQIDHARVDVSLEGQSESISQNYRYTLCDAAGEPVDAEDVVTNTAEVHLDLKIERFEEAKLVLNLVYGGGVTAENVVVDIKPATIKISGSEALLQGLKEINLGTVNLAEITDTKQLSFPINLPESVTNLSGITDAAVNIEFVGVSSKEFVVENLQAKNVPEGLEYNLMSEVLKVTLRGPTAQINALKPEDIVATVDLTGKEIGTLTCKATVSITADGFEDIGAVGSYSVSVTLLEEGEP